MSVESWQRAWEAASTRSEARWLVVEARKRDELTDALRGLLRSTFPPDAPTVAETVAAPQTAADGVLGHDPPHPDEET